MRTTASRVSPGPTRDTTARRSTGSWRRSTAEPRWSSSETSTSPSITTCGSASPGTTTVRHGEMESPGGGKKCHTLGPSRPFVTLTRCLFAVGWAWTDYTSLGFLNWAPGEPNEAFHPGEVGDENCVEMRSDGSWNDNNCLAKRGFVCQHRQCKSAPRRSHTLLFFSPLFVDFLFFDFNASSFSTSSRPHNR